MTAPRSTLYQMDYQNPHAAGKLTIPVLVLCNTPIEDLLAHIKANSAKDREWIGFAEPHDRVAILCGGGPSLENYIEGIWHKANGKHDVFAMNGASKFLRMFDIPVKWQVIADAKPETLQLVDTQAEGHLFASQVYPALFSAAPGAKLWHLECEGMEDEFPPERRKRGGYALCGGGAAVGNAACCLAYVMGYRTLHLFGYDSSHRQGRSHAYDQPMNWNIPTIDVEWAGKQFTSSLAMKAQAEKFMITGQALKAEGVEIHVHGDGLLPTMWNTPPEHITERDKYRLCWQTEEYRKYSPGEALLDLFVEAMRPEGLVIDFGCGTGRAALELAKLGHDVFCVDFADNCRDEEAIGLPFLEWDLTRPIPARGNVGYCTDVMEHIPTDDVYKVLNNIMEAVPRCFFNISTIRATYGDAMGLDLHVTVKPHRWWRQTIESLGLRVAHDKENDIDSIFIVERVNG